MRLLLVDDDAALRALVRTTFEAVEVEVDEAEHVVSARRAVSRSAPDDTVNTSAAANNSRRRR